jgi:predicted ester cyclase
VNAENADKSPLAVAEAYVAAYNANDLEAMSRLMSADVHVVHHNRGVDRQGWETVLAGKKAAEAAMPDKRFRDRTRQLVSGDVVVFQHTWTGNPTTDLPGYAVAGKEVNMELCTIFTIRDGQIVEYDDYG